jgi:zinc protease
MKRTLRTLAVLLTVIGPLLTGCQQEQSSASGETTEAAAPSRTIPERPEQLKFDEFKIKVPEAAKYRHELPGGNRLYVVEDHALPLVKITIYSRLGSYAIADEDVGVAQVFSRMLREGGTSTMTPAEVDNRLDFLATSIEFDLSDTFATASLDSLTDNLGASLDILMALLTDNRFDAERLEVAKKSALESIKQRNDDTRRIESREWNRLVWGDDFFANRMATAEQIRKVTPEKLRAYARRIFANGQLVIAVSGDVKTDDMIQTLSQVVSKLPKATEAPALSTEVKPSAPGLYGINKADVTQTRVSLGHLGLLRGSEDEMAVRVMNEILGGGGFTSRITSRVRSDEGLAYSAGSYFSFDTRFLRPFRAFFQSKNRTVAYALKIVLDEIQRIRQEPVTEGELRIARESIKSQLADVFDSADSTAATFAFSDLDGRPDDYWTSWTAKTDAVTVQDVQRVAQKYLHPDQLRILVVGKLDEAMAGDGEHGTLEEVAGGKLQRIPLRDPETLEPLPLD